MKIRLGSCYLSSHIVELDKMSDEEEEILIYMDFNTKLDDEYISADKEFKIIGIDSEKPILQLGNQVYRGEWTDAVGTEIIFEEDENVTKGDPLFTDSSSTFMKFSCKTEKVLHMSRIFLNSKNFTVNDSRTENKSVSDE